MPLVAIAISSSTMTSVESLREVVRNLAETFNNPQIRESSYFNFYDDSLTIHGFPPNLPVNKGGLVVHQNSMEGIS
jgi:2-phosphoglycerate kinase